MGDRAVYCARLESVCAERHPGFESPPIRHTLSLLLYSCSLRLDLFDSIAPFEHLNFLPKLDHAAIGQDAAKIHARINHAIAS